MTPRAFRWRVLLLVALGIVAVAIALWLPPIRQDPAYHDFADRRTLVGVPHALNVLSNAAFVVVGALGIAVVLAAPASGRTNLPADPWVRVAFTVLFTGVALTGFGSAYYHLAPSDATLFWDRMPLTIVFMSLFGILVEERVSASAGRRLFPLWLAIGLGSVVYWQTSASADLRLYGLVQFLPMLATPLMLLLFPARHTRTADLFVALAWYVAAKILEHFDPQVFALGHVVSGHTLKHLASALAAYWILRMLQRRDRRRLHGAVTPGCGRVLAASQTDQPRAGATPS